MSERDTPKKGNGTAKKDTTPDPALEAEKEEDEVSRDAPQTSAPATVTEEPVEQPYDIHEFNNDDDLMVEFTIHEAYQSKIYHPRWRVCLIDETDFTGRSMRWVNRKPKQFTKGGKPGSWKHAMGKVGG